MLLDLVNNGLRHVALHQGFGPVGGYFPQYVSQRRVAQYKANVMRLAVSLVKVRCCNWIFFEMGFCQQQRVQPCTDLEAAICQGDGRRKQRGPRQLAILPVNHLQHAQCARRPHRATTDHSVIKRQRFAISTKEEFFVRRCGRCLTPVKGFDVLAVEVHQERAATQATALRLHQRQHHLHSNGGVGCAATCFENLIARIGG